MSSNEYIMIKSTKPPYSTSAAVDALEAAMAASNIGIVVKFVFIDDGVYQLLPSQDASLINHKSVYKRLKALPLYDVEDVYVHSAALSKLNVDLHKVDIPVEIIDNETLVNMSKQAIQVLVF